jgi:hypothetical protein
VATNNGRTAGWLQGVGGVFAVTGLIFFFLDQSAFGICMAVLGLSLFASGVAAARKTVTASHSTTGQPPVEGDRGRAEPA